MEKQVEVILRGSQFKQLLESQFSDIRKEYDLKRIEIEVLYFLSECGEKNTCTDIYQYLQANKGHVSRAVDSLCKKNYLVAIPDKEDRRYIHYMLTDTASEIINNISAGWKRMNREIFIGVSEEELRIFQKVAKKIGKNMERICQK